MRYVWHIVRYILAFVANLLILLFVHSYFNYMIMIIMLVMPLISAAVCVWTSGRLKISFSGTEGEVGLGEPFLLSVILNNQSIFPIMNVDVKLSFSNELFDLKSEHTLCIPAYVKNANVVDYQLEEQYVGVLLVKADTLYVTDWLGFFRVKRKINVERSVTVYPNSYISAEPDMSAVRSGMNESEESNKKGHDFSEVVDVREYIPGDKLQNIHWKLSAKRETLMVKERQSMSSEKLIVFVDMYNDEANVLNDVLKAAYGLACFLIDNNISFELAYFSEINKDVVPECIDSYEELKLFMDMMFYDKAYTTGGYGLSNFRRMLEAEKKLVAVTADDLSGNKELFSYGSSVKGYILE